MYHIEVSKGSLGAGLSRGEIMEQGELNGMGFEREKTKKRGLDDWH